MLREGRKEERAIGTHQPGNVRTVVLEFLVVGACELGSCGMPSPQAFCRRRGQKEEVGSATSLSFSLFLFLYPSLSSSMRCSNNDGDNNKVRGRKEAKEWKACYYNNALLACLPPGILPEATLVCTVRYANPVQYNRAKRLPAACPPFYSTDS